MHANEIVSIIPTVQSKLRSVYERYVVFSIKQFIQYGNYQHIYHTMNINTNTPVLPWGGAARASARPREFYNVRAPRYERRRPLCTFCRQKRTDTI